MGETVETVASEATCCFTQGAQLFCAFNHPAARRATASTDEGQKPRGMGMSSSGWIGPTYSRPLRSTMPSTVTTMFAPSFSFTPRLAVVNPDVGDPKNRVFARALNAIAIASAELPVPPSIKTATGALARCMR